MPTSPNAVIGYIVDVQDNLLVATLIEDEQGHAPIVTIGDEDVLVGQLGSYVAVKQNNVHLIAIVTRMTEQESLAGLDNRDSRRRCSEVAFRQANRAADACRVDYRERPVRAWCGPISDDGGGGPRDWISGHRNNVRPLPV